MSSRSLAGALLLMCAGVTGCTGRQIQSMREHPAETPSGPTAAVSAKPWTGPAVVPNSTYPKDINAARPAPPAQYASMKDPLPPTPDDLAKGKELFNANCAPCHGTNGAGNGPAAASLNPKPADFQSPIHAKLPDGYWFWRLSVGGTVSPFKDVGSAMPPWEGALTEQQRWLIILYEHTFSEHK
jgi:mono/diheme cytochrome c family protein